MKIYEVIPNFGGPSHVVIARNEEESIETTVENLNQFQTAHLFKTSEFCASDAVGRHDDRHRSAWQDYEHWSV